MVHLIHNGGKTSACLGRERSRVACCLQSLRVSAKHDTDRSSNSCQALSSLGDIASATKGW